MNNGLPRSMLFTSSLFGNSSVTVILLISSQITLRDFSFFIC